MRSANGSTRRWKPLAIHDRREVQPAVFASTVGENLVLVRNADRPDARLAVVHFAIMRTSDKLKGHVFRLSFLSHDIAPKKA